MFSNKSYLAFPYNEKENEFLKNRIIGMCAQFRIGLITFSDVNDFETYEEKITPERKLPNPENVDKFISQQIEIKNQSKIKAWL